MTYWVEYKHMKGIRENLMTDSIVEARKKAYRVVDHDVKKSAMIYASKDAYVPVGSLFFLGGYYGWMLWNSYTGKTYHAYHVGKDGELYGRAKE